MASLRGFGIIAKFGTLNRCPPEALGDGTWYSVELLLPLYAISAMSQRVIAGGLGVAA